MGPPPPPITVTGSGGAGWELPVPGLGLWHCPGPVWGGWVLAALLPEAAGEVPPGDSALPVTAMHQGAGPRVSRGMRRAGAGVTRPDRTGRCRSALRPDGDPGQAGAGPWEAGPTRSLPCVALPSQSPPGGAARWARLGPGLGLRRARSGDAGQRGVGERTMRPAEARAARVGQGGARVAECVCVRLSVNADSPQVIGRAQQARPALRRRPLVGLNTKAPARPALRVGPVARAWEAGASTTSRLWDLSVPSCARAHARAAPGP